MILARIRLYEAPEEANELFAQVVAEAEGDRETLAVAHRGLRLVQLPASGRIAHFSAIVAGEIVGHGFSALPSGAPPRSAFVPPTRGSGRASPVRVSGVRRSRGRLGGVAHGDGGVDAVAVSTADPFTLDVAGFHQVGDDPLGGPLGDSNPLGDVTNRASGSRWRQRRTWVWLERNRQSCCRLQSLTYDISSVYCFSYVVCRVNVSATSEGMLHHERRLLVP